MKKIFAAVVFITLFLLFINSEVTIKRGVDFKVGLVKMPLYLKVLDFFDRHYNYKNLVKGIVESSDNDHDRVLKILKWTHDNMKKVPTGMPVMDDHVWYTIVRGYGTDDQFSDVFSTLCNYAGLRASCGIAYDKDKKGSVYLSYVKTARGWTAVDPYNFVYFEDRSGSLAVMEELKKGDYLERYLSESGRGKRDYKKYFDNVESAKLNKLERPSIQSPLNRFIFQITGRK